MKKNEQFYSFFAAVEVGEELYFSSWLKNALFKINMNTKEMKYLGRVKEEKREENLHKFAFFYENNVYFIPAVGDYITKLCLIDMSIHTIEIPLTYSQELLNKFSDIVFIQDELWLIPFAYKALIKLNLKTEEIEKFDNWPGASNCWKSKLYLFCSGIYFSNKLYMCPYESDYFVVFDLDKKEMETWKWNYPKHAFCKMILCEHAFWFLPEMDYPYIVAYSLNTKEKYCIETKENTKGVTYSLHVDAAVIREYIILLPYELEYWFILNAKTRQIEKIPVKREKSKKISKFPLFQTVSYFKGGFIASSGINKFELFVKPGTYESEEISFILNDEDSYLMWIEIISSGGLYRQGKQSKECVFYENEVNLNTYARIISEHNCIDKIFAAEDTVGLKIYKESCR